MWEPKINKTKIARGKLRLVEEEDEGMLGQMDLNNKLNEN